MIFKLRVSRTQWAVGHGFFHSGIIEAGGKPFVYVYDCGARLVNQKAGLLDQEIDEFGARLKKKSDPQSVLLAFRLPLLVPPLASRSTC